VTTNLIDAIIEIGEKRRELADPRTAELLGVPKREPLLRIRQAIYSTKGMSCSMFLGYIVLIVTTS
jgi:hypothetical protein